MQIMIVWMRSDFGDGWAILGSGRRRGFLRARRLCAARRRCDFLEQAESTKHLGSKRVCRDLCTGHAAGHHFRRDRSLCGRRVGSVPSTIFAWGLREDVGFLLLHGENLAGAAARSRRRKTNARCRGANDVDANRTGEVRSRARRGIDWRSYCKSNFLNCSVAENATVNGLRRPSRTRNCRRRAGDCRLAKLRSTGCL